MITLTTHEAARLAIELDFLLSWHRQFYYAILNDDSPASEIDRVDALVSTASRIQLIERIVAELRADRITVGSVATPELEEKLPALFASKLLTGG